MATENQQANTLNKPAAIATPQVQNNPVPIDKPGGGYVSSDPNVQAQIARMQAQATGTLPQASANPQVQTQIVSQQTPGTVVSGPVTGQTQGGQGIASVPTTYQASTTTPASQMAAKVQSDVDSARRQAGGTLTTDVESRIRADSTMRYNAATNGKNVPTIGGPEQGLTYDPTSGTFRNSSGAYVQSAPAGGSITYTSSANDAAKFNPTSSGYQQVVSGKQASQSATSAASQLNPTMNADASTLIQSGLSPTDSGLITTTNYETSRNALGNTITSLEKNNVSDIISSTDEMFNNLIAQNKEEYARLQSYSIDSSRDPLGAMLLGRQQHIASQMGRALGDIQAQADADLKNQEKVNKDLEGKARAAANAAGWVGSMVGEGYIANQIQNNLDALQSIKTAAQHAINEARTAFEERNDELAFQMVSLAENRKQQAQQLLQTNAELAGQMESMKMQRMQFAQQAQLQEMQMRFEGKKAASDFLSSYAKQGLSPDAVPDTVWQTAVDESGGRITKDVAKALYAGSLKDQQAADLKSFNENTKAFYEAAKLLPQDSGAVLNRPNLDGSFSSIKRSDVKFAPDYDVFEITEGGKKYRQFVDKNDPTAKPLKIEAGTADPNYVYKEDAIGNTWQINETTNEKKMIFDFAGNPSGAGDVASTGSFLQNNAEEYGQNVLDYGDAKGVGQPLGSLSAKFESSGNPGAIGYDKVGGLSYGTYQLAHNNAKRFVDESRYSAQFKNIPFNSKQFQDKWKELAKQDPKGFEQAQHDYIKKTHYDPQVNKLAKSGVNISSYSPVLQDVVWSTAVQHGGGTDVIEKAFKRVGKDAPEDRLIKAIYQERWAGGDRFQSSEKDVQNSVYKRFFGKNGEQTLALARLQSNETLPKDNAMAWHISADEGSPVSTNIKNGTVEEAEQIGVKSDGKPIMRVVVKNLDTGMKHEFRGMEFSDLKQGMSWGESEQAPSIGQSAEGGYSQSIYNHDNSPVKPTGEIDIAKYGTWGRLASIPPKLQANMEKIRNDVEKGIDLDTVIRRVKSDPLLSQVRSDVILNELSGTAKYVQDVKAKEIADKAEAKIEAAELKRMTAEAKPPTVDQAKNAGFAMRAGNAMSIFDRLENQISSMSTADLAFQRKLPTWLGKSSEMQQQQQAESDFINAILRRESGATILPAEFQSYEQTYFPQPGNPPEVLAQKKEARRIQLEGLVLGSGNALSGSFAREHGIASNSIDNGTSLEGETWIDPATGEEYILK